MARGNPEPRYRPSRKTWYVTLNGVQHNFRTADKAEAYDRWHQLMAGSAEPISGSQNRSVVGVQALFAEWSKKHKAPATYGERGQRILAWAN